MKLRGSWAISSDQVVLLSLLALSLGLNLYLGANLYLSGRSAHQPSAFKKGDSLRTLLVRDVRGQRHELAFASTQSTVLYVLRPDCSWCKRNSGSVNKLFNDSSSAYRFIAISVDERGLDDFLMQSKLAFPAYSLEPGRSWASSKFGSVPQTLVVGRDGSISEVWLGAYVGDNKVAIEKHFRTSLPSLE